MSTYLQLCKDVCREVGIAQGEDAITTVVGQSGDRQRIIKWVASEWKKIQNKHGGVWRWMRRTATVNTTADDGDYAYSEFTDSTTTTAITRFNRWRIEDIRDFAKCYLTSNGSSGEWWLTFVPWNDFKSLYKIGSGRTISGAPAHITIDPNNVIHLGPIPNDVYTITVDYYLSPQEFVQTNDGNSDEPEMPSQFHDLITWMAVTRYGYFKLKKESIASGEEESRRLLYQLRADQLPRIGLGAPLVG